MDKYDYPEPEEAQRDAAIDNAILSVRAFFEASPKRLFYSTQIETSLERTFFSLDHGESVA